MFVRCRCIVCRRAKKIGGILVSWCSLSLLSSPSCVVVAAVVVAAVIVGVVSAGVSAGVVVVVVASCPLPLRVAKLK
jgi:hypothetical protein